MTDVQVPLRQRSVPPDDQLEEGDLRTIVEFAGLAPSVHNTQPWRFVAGSQTVEVYADDSRRLSYLDPEGRQQAISCGAAIEYARLAIRGLGRSCVMRLLPDDAVPGPLATLTIGRSQPVTREEQRFIDAVPRRRTDRGPYDPRPVPEAVFRRVRDLVTARGCWLRVLDRPGDRLVAGNLLQRAEAMETADSEYVDELRRWRRTRTAPDGVPAPATPEWDAGSLVSDLPLRDFTGRRRHPRPGGQEPPPCVTHDAVILIGTDDDTRSSWLRAGAAIALAWLAITAADLAMQPLGPVTDVPTTRTWLRRELGLIGQPQLMFRLGYGVTPPATGRRAAADVLQISQPR